MCRGRNRIEKEREKERTATTNYFLLNSLAGYDSLVAYMMLVVVIHRTIYCVVHP